MLSVDIAVLARDTEGWNSLLVRRVNLPQAGSWAFPGGKVEVGETTTEAASRALAAETGISLSEEDLVQIDQFFDPERDPRDGFARLLLIAVIPTMIEPRPGPEIREAHWWPFSGQGSDLAKLDWAVDHEELARDVRRIVPWSPVPTMRRVVERDVPLVLRLHHSALKAAGAHAGPGPWDDDLENLHSAYLGNGGEFLVATIGPAVIGMGALRRVDSELAEVKRMRVLPSWQGLGIGRSIAKALIARAKDLGFRRLMLDTTPHQTAAIGMYTSLGFTQTGETTVAGLHSLLFTKSI